MSVSGNPEDVKATKSQGFEFLTSSRFLFPFRYIGVAFLLAWLMSININTIFFSNQLPFDARNTFTDIHRVVDVLTFLVLASLSARIGRLGNRKILQRIALAFALGGTCAVYILGATGCEIQSLYAVCGVATGFGSAIFFLSWCEIYTSLGDYKTMLFGAVFCVFALFVSSVILSLRPPINALFVLLLPILVYVTLRLSYVHIRPESDAVTTKIEKQKTRYAFLWMPVLVMSAYGFSSGFSAPMFQPGGEYRMLATGLTGIVVLLGMFVFRERFKITQIVYLAFAFTALGFILIPLLGTDPGIMSLVFIKLGYLMFTVAILFLLGHFANRTGVSPIWVFGLARASSETGIGLGIVISRYLIANTGFSESTHWYIAIVALVSLGICMILWVTAQRKANGWGIRTVDIVTGLIVKSDREYLIQSAEAVVKRYGLTSREGEILLYLAQDISRSEIEERLFISTNTVKTHMRHIYNKLSIHSQEELVAMVKAELSRQRQDEIQRSLSILPADE